MIRCVRHQPLQEKIVAATSAAENLDICGFFTIGHHALHHMTERDPTIAM